jgi:hypothetical protein
MIYIYIKKFLLVATIIRIHFYKINKKGWKSENDRQEKKGD